VGSSGSGKTTLIAALTPEFQTLGYRVGVVKHARHGFDIDRPGKDTYRFREAGAVQVMVASNERWALMGEFPDRWADPPLGELVARFDPREVDLLLVEGFAGERIPKIEVYRPAHGEPPKCWPADPDVIAVASDQPVPPYGSTAIGLDLNRPTEMAEFLCSALSLVPASRASVHAD
jgi:molybdopterin-guanine dinucleotide biosynthesis protein B